MKKFDFASECYDQIGSSLLTLGFKKRLVGVFTLELSTGVYGWIGLNRVRKDTDELELYPIVGVIHESVNELISSLPISNRNLSPTVSVPLCYLLEAGKYRTWIWKRGNDEHAVTKELVEFIRRKALVFMERFSSLDSFYLELVNGESTNSNSLTVNSQRVVPAILLLLKKFDQIEPFLERELRANENLGGDPDFEVFAARMLQKSRDRGAPSACPRSV